MLKIGLRILILTFLLSITGTVLVNAQTTANALQNPSFEEGSFGQYTQRRGGEKPIYLPSAWNYWLNSNTQNQFYNRADRVSMFPHPGPGPSPMDGGRALNIDCGFVTCAVAIYQQVGGVTPGQKVTASAYSQVKACNLGGNTTCGSAVESGSQTRIGIDPSGGTDPNNAAIVWSGWTAPHDAWKQQSVEATATGTTVTLFLYSTQTNFADLNKTYWDAAALAGGGAGSAAPSQNSTPGATSVPPTATPPPSVPFVVPQGAQADGSIIHTVTAGDTMDSIAVAYGVTRTQIMELNNITDARIISIGQRLIISQPTTANNDTEEPAASETEVPEAEATQETEVVIGVASEETIAPPLASEPTAETGAAEATPEADAPEENQPTPQPTVPLATAPVVVAQAGNIDPASTEAQVCVLLFNDENQNRIQEPGEVLLSGGTITLALGSENVGSYTTDGASEPHCFDALDAGDYVALASAPQGYGLTTPDQLRLQANPGPAINIAFGAAEGVQPAVIPAVDVADVAEETVQQESTTTSLFDQLLANSGLIVFGLAAVVLIGGVGLTVLLRRR